MAGGGNDQKPRPSERIESWRDFQAQLLQCWVGEAIARVVQYAVARNNSNSFDVQSIALVSLFSAQQVEDAAAFTNISAFVTQFLKIQHAHCYGDGGSNGDEDPGPRLYVASVTDADGFQHWLQSHRHEQQLSSQDRQQGATCLVILYAPLLSVEKKEGIAQIVIATGGEDARMIRTLLLMINDPIGLMDLDCDSPSSLSSSCYKFVDSHAITTDNESSLSIPSSERLLVRPLRQLGSQCGLRFVMEIARWTVFKEELRNAGGADGAGTTVGPRPPAMLASVSQMPFQLLLLALRWSHFHPTLVRAFAKPFERKLGLIPQHRVREAICQLRTQEMALWSHLESGFEDPLDQILSIPDRRKLSTASEITIPLGEEAEEHKESKLKGSLSECQLWDVQKQFYLAQGIRAWSDGIIPFGVSSSSFLAAAYARVAVDFFLEAAGTTDDSFDTGDTPNCFVWEAASGSCKFLHAFLVHFNQLIEEDHEFTCRGLRPCVVASDLSDQVLESRMEMACFQPFLQDQRLEFARFDTAAFTRGDTKKQLILKHSKRIWHVGRDGPVFLMGNYFFDSLRADVFAVTKSTTTSAFGPLDEVGPIEDTPIEVFEGRVDHQTTSITNMELSFQVIDPLVKAVYDDPFVNQVFTDVIESIKSTPASTQPSSLILFPVEAIQFILSLVDTSSPMEDNISCPRRGFPVGIMIGDASFSFRDPIPSAFFNQEDGGRNELLEIPQLSPHPDCFCLPVDFEILRLFLQRLTSQLSTPAAGPVTSGQVASAIATDTFDVLYSRICPQLNREQAHDDHEDSFRTIIQPSTSSLRPSTTLSSSQVAFAQEFASFTPSDCDLLWGMMGVDDGAAHFSLKTQIGLLAQSAWDFDLFVVLQWKLMRLWRRMFSAAVETTGSTTGTNYHEQMRLQLIAIAKKCWRTFYSLDGENSKIGEVSQLLSLLQVCRWLYELKAHAEVISRLSESIKRTPKLEMNISICYLLALAYHYSGDLWQALVYFRKCFAIAPTRVKFRRRIAQTLLALQRQKLQETESS